MRGSFLIAVVGLGVLGMGAGPGSRPATRPVATTAQVLGDRFVERLEPHEAKFEMVFVPGGRFWMGSAEGEKGREASEGPRHEVRVEPFWMGKVEVTADLVMVWLDEWRIAKRDFKHEFELTDAAKRAASEVECEFPWAPFYDWEATDPMKDLPATTLTAYGAQQFCMWLSVRTGRYYRLPTEAEWEYACRAGTATAYSFGDDPKVLGEYAWVGREATGPVGRKRSNAWGLYDMHGNVGEYVLDDWSGDYREYAGKVSVEPWRKHVDRDYAVVRGGDVDGGATQLRSASRRRMKQEQEPNSGGKVFNGNTLPRGIWTGFRVVSPMRVEGDGREACIPAPEYPKLK